MLQHHYSPLHVLLLLCLWRNVWSFSLGNDSKETTKSDGVSQTVVVVGAGVGGLATAARIASKLPSTKITVLEKNTEAGGRCGSFEVTVEGRKFRHERGPSLLLLPHVYRQVFEDCGARMEDYGLNITQCIPAYQVVFEDGDRIDVGFPRDSTSAPMSDAEIQSRAKMDSFEREGASKWDEYMKTCEAFLDCGLPNFIEERLDLASFPAFLREALRDFGKAWPLKPHSDVLDAIFESTKMRALASFQDLYVGLEPYRNRKDILGGGVLSSTAPAVFGLLAAIELHPSNEKCGVFAPVGGFQSFASALEKLALDLDVTIEYGKMVTSLTEKGVYYVDSAKENSSPVFLPADLIVVNADLPYAKKMLLGADSSPEIPRFDWDDGFHFSSGVVAFHWSVSKCLVDLNTHNVFMIAGSRTEAEESWMVLRDKPDSQRSDSSVPGCFNFYVHRPSQSDATAAPEGCDSILILVPCSSLLRHPEYADLPREAAIDCYAKQFDKTMVDQIREAVLRRMAKIESLRDLRSLIVGEVYDTPATYAGWYNVAAGTPFALSHGLMQLSLLRPGPVSTELSNALFTGASSRPGNGIPLVLTGAKLVAEEACSRIVARSQEV